jgi:hypothetical protein
MNRSRGVLHFSRRYTVRELGFGNPEPFVGPLIRQFLKIGEAVAGRWIEMPDGVLFLQMVQDVLDSGAIYLYDRIRQVFYQVWFEGGDDDHLTVEDFNQLLTEYDLLKYAECPKLAHQMATTEAKKAETEIPVACDSTTAVMANSNLSDAKSSDPVYSIASLTATRPCRSFPSTPGNRRYTIPAISRVRWQKAGSA